MKIKIGKFGDNGGKKRFDVKIAYRARSLIALKADEIENIEEIKKIADEVNQIHGCRVVSAHVVHGIFYLDVLSPNIKINDLNYELLIR